MKHLLLVEDTLTLGKNVARYLELKDYKVTHVLSAEEAEKTLEHQSDISLILLDIHLPGISGIEFLEKMRKHGNFLPVIFLTSKDSDEDVVAGLKLGADDYISKPFDYEVLIARIESVIRRSQKNIDPEPFQMLGKYKISLEKKQVYDSIDKKNIYLAHLEFELLAFFLKNKGKVCDRAQIYEAVWGEFENYYFSRTVDVYVGYLRKKLGENIILTRKGSGYFLNENYE